MTELIHQLMNLASEFAKYYLSYFTNIHNFVLYIICVYIGQSCGLSSLNFTNNKGCSKPKKILPRLTPLFRAVGWFAKAEFYVLKLQPICQVNQTAVTFEPLLKFLNLSGFKMC